jgi:3-oxoacyl-[acyl-carrier protein] reductase
METGLTHRAALVCAASRGLGRAAAEALAREGARVMICARDAEQVAGTARDLVARTGAEVRAAPADVRIAADVERIVAATADAFGGLDILVTNAGGPPSGTFESIREDEWREAIDLLLLSVVRLCRAAIPLLRRSGRGRIINVTSVSVKQPIPSLVLSNALRAAVVGLSKTLSGELAVDGVTVNCVAPGYTRTDRLTMLNEARAAREGVTPADIERRTVESIPLGRLGEPLEFGDLVAFLASDRAAYITGTTIQVDGGFVRGVL